MATLTTPKNAAPRGDTQRKARLEFRSTLTQKTIIERAAALMGESVTSFVLSTVLQSAQKVIHEHRVTELSLDDWARFTALMESDSEPNKELSNAVRLYQKRVTSSDGL